MNFRISMVINKKNSNFAENFTFVIRLLKISKCAVTISQAKFSLADYQLRFCQRHFHWLITSSVRCKE